MEKIPNLEVIALEGYTLDATPMARKWQRGHSIGSVSRLCQQREALSLVPRILQEMETAAIRNLGEARSLFYPSRHRTFRRDNPKTTIQFLDADPLRSERV